MKTDPGDKRSQIVNFSPGSLEWGRVRRGVEPAGEGALGSDWSQGPGVVAKGLERGLGRASDARELSRREIAHGKKLWEEEREKKRQVRRRAKPTRASARK